METGARYTALCVMLIMISETVRRRARTAFLAVCTLAFVVTLAGWARSYCRSDELRYAVVSKPVGPGAVEGLSLAHGEGDVVIIYFQGSKAVLFTPGWRYVRLTNGPVRNMLPVYMRGIGGYGVGTDVPLPSLSRYVAIALPYWLPALITGTPWVVLGWRHWRSRAARRIAAGWCPACGYDVRATPDRCPECGATRPTTPAPLPGIA